MKKAFEYYSDEEFYKVRINIDDKGAFIKEVIKFGVYVKVSEAVVDKEFDQIFLGPINYRFFIGKNFDIESGGYYNFKFYQEILCKYANSYLG
jgi:hypothetical protein